MNNGYENEEFEAVKETKIKSRVLSVVAFVAAVFYVEFCFIPWL